MRRYLFLAFFFLPATLVAVTPPDDSAGKLPDGTANAEKQIATFRTPPGFKVELFAAEPKLASPVAIAVDERGRVYVAEEHRFNRGTEENRTRPFFLDDDLQIRTLYDRLKMYEKWQSKFDGGMNWFTNTADQLRLLEDTTGSGRANKSELVAKFNGTLDGLFSGVMATNGDVYLTCIPNLYVIPKGSTTPKVLLSGFGVNCAFLGHDLHGLCWGPDGKLYFSIGDRGYDVKSREGRQFNNPRTGAVFRCNPDGTEFEVVHTGLRNPQELAFDQYGNLFADDNNCDKGDHGRLVYVVEGGESGWNMAYQTINPHQIAPWFSERIWHLQNVGQPAHIVPPVGVIGNGPSGFLFTSGTALPDRYSNSFLMCNYVGNGGLESFKVNPVGAGFEIQDYHDFLKPIKATDAEFGYDGKLYVSDFVDLDWSGKSLGGRIYTMFDPKKLNDPIITSTKQLFADGFEKLSNERLVELLAHPDQRARLRSQFELMKRGENVAPTLAKIALTSREQLARLHAIWALRPRLHTHAAKLDALLSDADAEVRAQYAKTLGDAKVSAATDRLVQLLTDSNARVKFFAAQSLGKLQAKSAIEPLFALLKANADADAYLRHACVVALATIDEKDIVAAKANDASAAVRMAVVLIQRRWHDPRIAVALNDADGYVRIEAARAIHDLPIDAAYPAFAATLSTIATKPIADGDAFARRAVHAAFRLGTLKHAQLVLATATNASCSTLVRQEAITSLAEWAEPGPRDRVTGFWRPLVPRDAASVRALVESNLNDLLAKSSGPLLTSVIAMMQKLGVKADRTQFVAWAKQPQHDAGLRVAALRWLASQKAEELESIVDAGLRDSTPLVRAECRELIAKSDAKRAVSVLRDALENQDATTLERQRALAVLGTMKTTNAMSVLDAWAKKLSEGSVPPTLRLDVLEAIRPALRQAYEKTLPSDLVGRYSTSLEGGDAERGREIFFNHTAAQCVRCHTINGAGGTAGPELSKVAAKYPERLREHFLESLLVPSAKLAEGFANLTLTLADGRIVAGTVMTEDKTHLTIQEPTGKRVTVKRDEIESRTKPTSGMPSVEKTLTPREIRDLVEYLTTLR